MQNIRTPANETTMPIFSFSGLYSGKKPVRYHSHPAPEMIFFLCGEYSVNFSAKEQVLCRQGDLLIIDQNVNHNQLFDGHPRGTRSDKPQFFQTGHHTEPCGKYPYKSELSAGDIQAGNAHEHFPVSSGFQNGKRPASAPSAVRQHKRDRLCLRLS